MIDNQSEVPIWPMFLRPVLLSLEGGDTLTRREIRQRALDLAGVTEAARQERLDSGGSRADQRADWAITHFGKAGCVERVARAQYRITDKGRQWLIDNPQGVSDFHTAKLMFDPYWPKSESKPNAPAAPEAPEDTNPVEQIESGIQLARTTVATELLDRLRTSHPDFFEEAVVRVLLAMGYGGADNRGKRIGGTGDGGVDGVIDQDALGLDQVYVQAKRYAEGNNVGRETIQAFVGALHGFGASRGIFITSSDFTAGAGEYAKKIPSRVILINGERLVNLMINYHVGIQVKETYELFEVDEDFFD